MISLEEEGISHRPVPIEGTTRFMKTLIRILTDLIRDDGMMLAAVHAPLHLKRAAWLPRPQPEH